MATTAIAHRNADIQRTVFSRRNLNVFDTLYTLPRLFTRSANTSTCSMSTINACKNDRDAHREQMPNVYIAHNNAVMMFARNIYVCKCTNIVSDADSTF